ncbi:sulfatase-like hydrolase/transferase [Polaribacter sp.]|uniref:sulfatase-like hydrolase/transferase n=1 Tax=Polaribacter sp. TaxID=1920175 RepID=UPI0025CF067D|nr:sulfatase-like hydrolase/transferase [Polaribacter sp.]
MRNLISIQGILLLLLCCVKSNLSHAQDKLNVLFIVSDDLTATAISTYQNGASVTPNIDKLASEGVQFNNAYSQFPVCGPSRASFMSGYYPHAANVFGYTSGREAIGSSRQTWPQLFKDNGYHSARVGKLFHMRVPKDIYQGLNGEDDPISWNERHNGQGPEFQASGEGELVQNNPNGTKPIADGNVMTIVKADGTDVLPDQVTANKAIQLLKENKDKPFWLGVGFVRPHVPFVAPEEYFTPYPWSSIVFPPSYNDNLNDVPARGINYVTSQKAQMNTTQERKAIAAYYASVAFMDNQVGRVLDALKAEGLEDNTIVIFASDHGFHLAEHRFWMKVSLKDESSKVPLIIKVPGKPAAVCNSFVELVDLYPTVASLAGLEYSPHIQGKDLSPVFNNASYSVRDFAFSVSQDGKSFLLRNDQYALILHEESGSKGRELYDIQEDPYQITNLANKPEYLETRVALATLLRAKLKEVRNNDITGYPDGVPLFISKELKSNKAIKVYPNITSNILNVVGCEPNSPYTIYNLKGVVVKEGFLNNNSVSLKNMSNGLVFIKVNTVVNKVIVAK